MKTDSMGNISCGEIAKHPQKLSPGFSVKNHSLIVNQVSSSFINTGVQISNAISEYTYCESSITDFQDPPNFSFVVYPSPAYNILNISRDFTSASIFNLIGEEIIFTQSSITKCDSVDVSSLPPGIYFLRAETSLGTITTKFIKE